MRRERDTHTFQIGYKSVGLIQQAQVCLFFLIGVEELEYSWLSILQFLGLYPKGKRLCISILGFGIQLWIEPRTNLWVGWQPKIYKKFL
jgi:hypothetical protein